MSIHRRVMEVNMALMNKKIKKTGWNPHKKFPYYELTDILPPVMSECHNRDIAVEFPFTEGVAILKLVDENDKKEYIPYRIQMPELVVPEQNPKKMDMRNTTLIQDTGANISYLQRYLLKLAFPCLSDKDMVDSGMSDDVKDDASSATGQNNNSSDKLEKPKKDEVADLPMGEIVLQAKEELNKKGVEDKDITYNALKKQILKGSWSVPERRAILNYFKEKEDSK